MNRFPVQIVELVQRRCSLRFGVGACEATGTPKCHQTYATCKFKAAFNRDGIIRWRFRRPSDVLPRLAEVVGDNEINTNAFPILESVSTRPTRVNIGASRRTESPFGIRSEVKISLRDFVFDNSVGDFYAADRSINASFAGLLQARIGEAQSQLEVNIYEGYTGQSLSEMQVSRFDVQGITGPSSGQWQITGIDPLSRANRIRATFPPTTPIQLDTLLGINATQTTGINVFAVNESDLTLDLGNTGATRYLRIGDEIISYTGYQDDAAGLTGVWELTGVTRGALNTTAAAHQKDTACQRVGRYELIRYYRLALDLLQNHTTLPADLIDSAEWEVEGNRYLATLLATGTVAEPTPVEDLIGELCRDGLFSTWWDERTQQIPIIAMRPPQGVPDTLTERKNIISQSLKKRPDDRITRVTVYYGQIDPTKGLDDIANYRNRLIRVDAASEGADYADGTIREKVIFSRWARTIANTRLVSAALLLRYKVTPQYYEAELDAKDSNLGIGRFVDVQSGDIIDPEGVVNSSRWQVIEYKPVIPREKIMALFELSPYVGKFAIIMANDAPSYADATETERLTGCWLADETTGLMPDGTDPYLLQ